MPTYGYTEQRDPQLWVKACQQIENEMLAEGWNKRSKKFSEVKLKKAVKLYRKLQ